MKLGPGASGPENWGSCPAGGIAISLLHIIQRASGSYPFDYVIDTGDLSGRNYPVNFFEY
jgi:hypothetical protein